MNRCCVSIGALLLTVGHGSGEFDYDAAVRQIICHVAAHHAHSRMLWDQERKNSGYVRESMVLILKCKIGVEYSWIENADPTARYIHGDVRSRSGSEHLRFFTSK